MTTPTRATLFTPTERSFMMRVFDTLQALLIASILGMILLAGSAVFAEEDNSHTYWHENDRSKSDFDADRSFSQEQMNREARRQNEALLDEYYSRKPNGYSQSPSYSNPNPPFLVFPGPGEKPRLCQRSFNSVYCQ